MQHRRDWMDQCIKNNLFSELLDDLEKRKVQEYSDWDKDTKTIYWLCSLQQTIEKESGKGGILRKAESIDEALQIFDGLKKRIQRLEWWPEYDVTDLLAYVSENGVTAEELVYLVGTVTVHQEYVLERISGSDRRIDFFEKTDEEIAGWLHAGDYKGKKICFITCTNVPSEYEEMSLWIDRLYLPEGMDIERLEVKGAVSMCSGYNEAMMASDAEYKVYLHQDVRILNPYFIYELLDAFQKNPKAGMLGLFGAEEIPETGVMWQTKRDGAVIHTEFATQQMYETFVEKTEYSSDVKVQLIDGFLMATRCDVKWREDLFKGWDFYDASQSMEFLKQGYEIVVPKQKIPWCLHDFGQISWGGYEENRQIFVENYLRKGNVPDMDKQEIREQSSIKEQIRELLDEGDFAGAEAILMRNLRGELSGLQSDPEYCILAASACLAIGNRNVAFELITLGLMKDCENYELYLLLGEYYLEENTEQALLCGYQAMYYCDNDEDGEEIQAFVQDLEQEGVQIRPVTIIIPSHNALSDLQRCVDSVMNTVPQGLADILIVDSASTDGTWEWLPEQEEIQYMIDDEEIGYVRAVNMGIKYADPESDILLLDPSEVLVRNTFFYLMMGLYAEKNVGAVGGITNAYIFDQRMSLAAADDALMTTQAEAVNLPMKNALEQVVCLSDHAVLLKREALDSIGVFDTSYGPRGYEDRDLSVRIHLAGYQVLLSYNSYILTNSDPLRYYGDPEQLTKAGSERFRKKWGYSIDYSSSARSELIAMIDHTEKERIRVLELGCAAGATLQRIKHQWKAAEVLGIEYDPEVARLGATMADIRQGDVESMEIPYEKESLDYIICADVLEHLRDPEQTILRFLPYLKKDGYFIISLPNVRNYAVVAMLLQYGRFDYADFGILDRTHLRFFTRDTAVEMLERSGLKVELIQRNYNGAPEQIAVIEKMKEAIDIEDADELRVFQYYFKCRKSD